MGDTRAMSQRTENEPTGLNIWPFKRNSQAHVSEVRDTTANHIRAVLGEEGYASFKKKKAAEARLQELTTIKTWVRNELDEVALSILESGFWEFFGYQIKKRWVNVSHNGHTPLTALSLKWMAHKVENLLSISDILINQPNEWGDTALIIAAREWHREHVKIVKMLLADKRMNLKAHSQWMRAMKITHNDEIDELIQEALMATKEPDSIFGKLTSLFH